MMRDSASNDDIRRKASEIRRTHDGLLVNIPSGAEAPSLIESGTYGLKPVPFKARHRRAYALLGLMMLFGCRQTYTVPETPMPPNTVLLSQALRQLSAKPGFTEGLLKEIGGNDKKKSTALMTPRLVDDLRKRILGKDWQGLDRFPGWSMREINPTVRVVGHIAGKDEKLEDAAAVHPGASLNAAQAGQYLDLGPYALNPGISEVETASLNQPSPLPPFSMEGLITSLGDGVTRGDGPNKFAPEHAESQRLADLLNRLAANGLEASQTFVVRVAGSAQCHCDDVSKTPQQLISKLQAAGHTVTVDDARYFANFTHLHFNGQDVMAPFWVDSQLVVPDSGGRHLLIPVSHAEMEWHIRGPLVNADVSYYFGIDGKSEWRTMDTLDQPWVLRRAAHAYTGAQAVEVTRLAGLLTIAYMHAHAAHPTLPFGGYYALGVCQDGVSAIEHAMTGKVTLFPNTVDASFFNDPRDAEVNALLRAIPKDRDGKAPEPERVFGSLPAEPGANHDFAAITIPGLADDLSVTYAAWQQGRSLRSHSRLFSVGIGIVVAMLVLLLYRRREQRG